MSNSFTHLSWGRLPALVMSLALAPSWVGAVNIPVPALTRTMIAAGEDHTLALTEDGRVWAWGSNDSGQLGDGTLTGRNAPVPVKTSSGMAKIKKIAAGTDFSMALDDNGALWAWGSNDEHQISADQTARFQEPVRIMLPSPILHFACGNGRSFAADSTKLWAWGDNTNGLLGVGHSNTVQGFAEITKPPTMGIITALASGDGASYVVGSNGKVWAWGTNEEGQLGDGTFVSQMSPVAVSLTTGLPSVKTISAGDGHVMARCNNGSIWTWGSNSNGQLAITTNPPTTSKNSPFQVFPVMTFDSAVAAGGTHSLAVYSFGQLAAWGANTQGQLGINSLTDSSIPIQLPNPVDPQNGSDSATFVRVAGGDAFSCTFKSDGSIWTWGKNTTGQLGVGDTIQRLIPTKIANLKLFNDDSDNDTLPDSWEKFYFNGNLSQSGSNIATANGVTNLVAYSRGLNPLLSDNDSDGMWDIWEIQHELEPTSDLDALEDPDGDRVPNVYEFSNGKTIPNQSVANPLMATARASLPLPHITVDRSVITETASLKKNISNAISDPLNPARHTIIRVKSGIYPESLNVEGKRILFLGDLGTDLPVIARPSGDAITIRGKWVVFDGFKIRPGVSMSIGRGFYIYTPSDKDQARIVNCTISGFFADYGGAAYLGQGKITLAHCTIVNNAAVSNGMAFNIYHGRLILQNSIVWNPAGAISEQIYRGISGSVTTFTSIILGGEFGGIATAPLLDRYDCLMPGSPALGAGSSLPVCLLDRHGEPRPELAPDIGADQYLDIDSDTLPDWWEIAFFDNLTKTAIDDNDLPEIDRLQNYFEYLLGFNPLLASTSGSDKGDFFEAVFLKQNDLWYPHDWNSDSEEDGLSNGQELYYKSNPLNADTNSDGINDAVALFIGVSLISNDSDNDGIANDIEIANGTNPLFPDSDSDTVEDGVDDFPFDPARWVFPEGVVGDVTSPMITLVEPVSAVFIP